MPQQIVRRNLPTSAQSAGLYNPSRTALPSVPTPSQSGGRRTLRGFTATEWRCSALTSSFMWILSNAYFGRSRLSRRLHHLRVMWWGERVGVVFGWRGGGALSGRAVMLPLPGHAKRWVPIPQRPLAALVRESGPCTPGGCRGYRVRNRTSVQCWLGL